MNMKTISSEMQSCIDSCYAAITACRVCLNQHLGELDMKNVISFVLTVLRYVLPVPVFALLNPLM
jgi:hypothetical protein